MQIYAKAISCFFFNNAIILKVHEYLKQKANYTSEKSLIMPKNLIDLSSTTLSKMVKLPLLFTEDHAKRIC